MEWYRLRHCMGAGATVQSVRVGRGTSLHGRGSDRAICAGGVWYVIAWARERPCNLRGWGNNLYGVHGDSTAVVCNCHGMTVGVVPLASLHGRGSDRAIFEGGNDCTEIPRQLCATAME